MTKPTKEGQCCCFCQRHNTMSLWPQLADPAFKTLCMTHHRLKMPWMVSHISLGIIYHHANSWPNTCRTVWILLCRSFQTLGYWSQDIWTATRMKPSHPTTPFARLSHNPLVAANSRQGVHKHAITLRNRAHTPTGWKIGSLPRPVPTSSWLYPARHSPRAPHSQG